MDRSFEPQRLSPTFLAQAYEKIIPHHIRVIRFESDPALKPNEGEPAGQTRRVA